MVYIHTLTGQYVFSWDRLLDEGLAFVQEGVPSCANFKCEVAYVNSGIPIDFRGIKCVSVESDQPFYDSIS